MRARLIFSGGCGISRSTTTERVEAGLVIGPSRRAIFERMARDGEQTVHALTDHSGVSQPAVSKHLGVLNHARLVRDRREGRETQGRRKNGFASNPAAYNRDGARWP